MTVGLPTKVPPARPLVTRAKSLARGVILVLDIGAVATAASMVAMQMGSGTLPTLEQIWRWFPPVFRSEGGLILLACYFLGRGTYLSVRGKTLLDESTTHPNDDGGS